MIERWCAGCKELHPESAFGPKGGKKHVGQLSSYCRKHKAKLSKAYRDDRLEENPDEWRSSEAERVKRGRIKRSKKRG